MKQKNKNLRKVVKEFSNKATNKKSPGVKPGTKRGPYKTKNKITNEATNTNDVIPGPVNVNNSDNNINNTVQYSSPQNESIKVPDVLESHTDTLNSSSSVNNLSDSPGIDNSGEDLFAKFKNEYGAGEDKKFEYQKTEPEKFQQQTSNFTPQQKQLINGRLLLGFCDFIIPGLLLKIISQFDDKYTRVGIKRQDIKLDEQQLKDLEPMADILAAEIFAKIDPKTAFFLSLGICYYSNLSFVYEVKHKEYLQRKKDQPKEPVKLIVEPEPAKQTKTIIAKKKKRK